MRRYACEGREGANCCSYERNEENARLWREETGKAIPRGCISCTHFNGLYCVLGTEDDE